MLVDVRLSGLTILDFLGERSIAKPDECSKCKVEGLLLRYTLVEAPSSTHHPLCIDTNESSKFREVDFDTCSYRTWNSHHALMDSHAVLHIDACFEFAESFARMCPEFLGFLSGSFVITEDLYLSSAYCMSGHEIGSMKQQKIRQFHIGRNIFLHKVEN